MIAKSFARIHWQNLVNFGVLPLTFTACDQHEALDTGAVLELRGLRQALRNGRQIQVHSDALESPLQLEHRLSARQVEMLLAGGLVNWLRERLPDAPPAS